MLRKSCTSHETVCCTAPLAGLPLQSIEPSDHSAIFDADPITDETVFPKRVSEGCVSESVLVHSSVQEDDVLLPDLDDVESPWAQLNESIPERAA